MSNEKNRAKLWTKDFIIIIVINFLVFLNHLMILSTFPFFVAELGYGDSLSGMCATLFSLVAVLCRPFIGFMLDNGKRKIILFLGMCGMTLMPLGYLVDYTVLASIALAVIMRMLHGMSLALSNTSTSTIATDIIPKERFAEGMGMFGMATALATACAPAIGEALYHKGFNVLFLAACASMALSLLLFAFLKTPKLTFDKKPLRFSQLISKDALPGSLVALVFLFTYGALENYILKYVEQSSDITMSGGLYFTIMAVMLFVTRVTIGKLADKKGEEVFVYTCNVSMLVALLLLSLCPNNVTFVISAALSGYGFGGIEPSLQAMSVSTAEPSRRGAANSTFLCAYDIGMGLGGGVAGVLIDHIGFSHMFAVMAAFNILSVVIYVIWGRQHSSSITYQIKHTKC